MACDYIIVQAGGKGTRLGKYTRNKPKALVPINNLPMIFHLFRKYPKKRFVIIGDYKEDVLRKYLEAFAEVQYTVVSAKGKEGTCSGIRDALDVIPAKESFVLIWSDLVLSDEFQLPSEDRNYVGLSDGFSCRWSYNSKAFEEIPSSDKGVAGFFIFTNKDVISDVPESGEFVRWLSRRDLEFNTLKLKGASEHGLLETLSTVKEGRCRPFNRMTFDGNRITKEGIDEQGRGLAVREKAWYKHVQKFKFTAVPEIFSYDPFIMERIDGKNVYSYDLKKEEKLKILKRITDKLEELHKLESVESDYFSVKDAYFNKTMRRLSKIRDLVPFANDETVKINGRVCRNIFWIRDEVEAKVEELERKEFNLIHGDCTFSNIMLKKGTEPILIDPRGYFGFTEMYGDPIYDWAKLYYSVCGNYDQFNNGKFDLTICDKEVTLKIDSNGWEEVAEDFLKIVASDADPADIKLIHALIWLSLTTYAWEDYDSICGAFYNGLYYMEEIL